MHGDFHIKNLMVNREDPSKDTTAIDWEIVGIGRGPTDLATLLVTGKSDLRKKCELSLLDDYYRTLVESGVSQSDYSKEQCYNDYVYGFLQLTIFKLAVIQVLKFPEERI